MKNLESNNNDTVREIIIFLLIAALIFISTLFYGGLGPTGNLIRLLLISVIAFLTFRNILTNGDLIFHFKRNLIYFVWVILFFAYLIFQFFAVSVNRFSSQSSFFHLFFSALIFFSLLVMNWEDYRFRIFKVLIFCGFFQATLVIIQKITGFAEVNAEFFQPPSSFTHVIQKALGIAGTAGTFFNPNFMVDFLFPIILLSIIIIFTRQLTKFAKVILWLNNILMFTAIFLSGSRGGIIAFFISAIALILLSRKRFYLIFIPIFLILFFIIPNPLKTKVLGGKEVDPYIYKRLDINQASFKMFLQKPIFGYGSGTYEDVAEHFKFPVTGGAANFRMIAKQAHNDYMQILVENGIVGFVFMFLLMGWILIKIIIARKKYDVFDYVLLASIIGLCIHALVDFNLRIPGVYTSLMLYIAILLREKNYGETFKYGGEKQLLVLIMLILVLFNVIIINEFIGVNLRERGKQLLALGNYDKAQEKLLLSTHFNHFDAEAHRLLGLTYMERFFREPSESLFVNTIDEFEFSMRYNKISGMIPFNLAYFFERFYFLKKINNQDANKERNQAIDYYKQAIKCEPSLVLYRYQLAKFYFKIKQYKNAINELDKAIEYEENYINAYLLKAVVQRELGNDKAGREAFDKGMEINKKFSGAENLNNYERQLLEIDVELENYLRKPSE
ncbi:MAG: O-antigen ligase family protein [bacterium]|nr:O-antigen ligase family protein [bacterium]